MDQSELIQGNLAQMTGLATQNHNEQELSPEEAVAMGQVMTQQYMAKNGFMTTEGVRPQHVRRQKVMTKGQYKEQMMNEEQGYPSNLDEASKVKDLENKVSGIESGISQILNRLSGGTNNVPPRVETFGTLQQVPTPTSPAYEPVYQTPTQSPDYGKPLATSRRVLPSGRVIEVPKQQIDLAPVPALSMGITGSSADLLEDPAEIVEDDSMWVEDAPVREVPRVDPKLERLANMVTEVSQWLRQKDALTFWKRTLPKIVSRHISYNGWPRHLQAQFEGQFKNILLDPVFLRNICSKVIGCEYGHALSVQKVAEFAVLIAGHMAFALAGI